MAHKITKFEEATEETDIAKIKQYKKFHKEVVGLVIATSAGFLGIGTVAIGNSFNAMIPMILGAVMQVVSHGIVVPAMVGDICNAYEEKDLEKDDNTNGGLGIWIKNTL